MKHLSYILTISIFLVIQFLFINPIKFTSTVSAADSWKNIYGICAVDQKAEDVYKNTKYAKQMGYEYIAINPSSTPKEYHKNPDCAGLTFYLTDPYFYPQVLSGYNRDIDTKGPISDEAKDFYNQRMVWKSNDAFPDNLATGYHPTGASTKFSVMWDFQQQAVIDEVVEEIISLAKSYQDTSLPFTFGGYIINEPKLAGEFSILDEKGDNVPVGLSYWTGADSGLVHGAITHEYATYSEGKAAFYKQLRARIAREFTNAKWIVQPSLLYSEVDNDEWIYQIKDRADKDELTPDMLSQGSWQNTNFVDDTNNFNSGVDITKGKVGNSQAGEVGEYKNRLFAARAGINGAWYNWFGRFGGTGNMPDFQSITDVYPRLKLIRCVPNWDNLNHVPLTDRSWDGGVYQSTKSYLSSDVMYSRHPKTGKLFAVFLALSGAVTLNAGERVTSVQRTGGFFIETRDGSADVNITGNEIRLKSMDNIGKGYIFTLSSDGDSSTVSTGSETDETSSSETSDGTVNASGLSGTVGYKYGSNKESSNRSKSSKQSASSPKTVTSQQSVSAQVQWQQVPIRTKAQKTAGFSGGEGHQWILDIKYAPITGSNPNGAIVYMSTDTSQVWKSVDGGATWQMKHSGIGARGIVSLVVSPYNENIVFGAGSSMNDSNTEQGLYRTTDGGDNWTKVKNTPYREPYRDGRQFFAFASATEIYAATQEGLMRSTNGGTAWATVAFSGQTIGDIKIHPTNSSILFVSSKTANKFYSLNLTTLVATQIGTGLPSYPLEVAIVPDSPSIMYAVAGYSGLYKSINGGKNFSSILSFAGRYAKYIEISPADSNYAYVSFMRDYNTSSYVGITYYTHNANTTGTTSWSTPSSYDTQNADGWITGWKGSGEAAQASSSASPIATHPTNRDVALISVGLHQLVKTTNGGATWSYSNDGSTGALTGNTTDKEDITAIGWDINNSNRFIVGNADYGVYLTTDGGDTFSWKTQVYQGVLGVAIQPILNSQIFIATSHPAGNYMNNGVYVSTNAGSSWSQKVAPDGNKRTAIFFDRKNPSIVYSGNYKSTNAGTTWSTLSKYVVTMYTGTMPYQTSYNPIYSVTTYGDTVTIYRSDDGGSTWTTNTANNPSVQYATFPYTYGSQITVSPNNPDKLYYADQSRGLRIINGNTSTFAQGIDNEVWPGSGWSTPATALVAVDPNNANIVYVGKYSYLGYPSKGVYRSTDGGANFTDITGNLGPNFSPMSMSVNPHNSYIYLGSDFGIWKLPPPGTTVPQDTTPPSISITSPTTSATYSTTQSTINISGTASDNVGVTSITWTNSANSTSGTASGTTSWSIASIALVSGSNTITVTARDAAGNSSTDTITVTYTPTATAVKSITVKKTPSSLTIDGNLNEYQWTNNVNESISITIKGTPNNTATFGAVYDDTYLYIGAKILDSNLINDSVNTWVDDSLEIYIDANHNHLTSYENLYDRQIIKGWNDTTIWEKNNNTANIQHAYYNITGGYTIEMAIPWTSLNTTPTSNLTIGFDLQQNDEDTAGAGQEKILNWNNTQSNNYLSTANFGHLILSSETIVSPDTTSPTITITSPTSGATYSSASSTINISGTASDNIGVTAVTWSNSANSTSGTASGTTSWSITGISLVSGSNPIIVTARDAAGNSSTGTLTVTYTAIDIIPPVVVITSPTTGTTFSTTQSTINISGTSSDNIGVSSVSWVSDKGGSGTASGTTNWSISGISLSSGDNVITVTVTDGANNVGTDTITVTYATSSQILTTNVAYTISSVTVDGNLNESGWNIITDVNKTVVGSVNNTAQFGILWDSTYLYVGVKVLDSNLYNDSTTVSEDDSIEIYIDGDHNRGTTYDSNDRQYIKGWNDSSIWEKSGKTTGVQHAWGTISGGYSVEVAIPWTNLGITPTEGMTIGLDIGYNDDDNGTGREGQAIWAGTKDSWQNTSVFGDAVLGNISALDTTAPACSISINSGASYTNSTTVTLALSATDDVGVTGYYLSTSSTTPLASVTGWTSVSSTTNYNSSVSYTLGSGDGKKTVYVWYKDVSGNVSSPALDSISLDTTVPAITITNPTNNSIYTATSSTMSLGGDVSDSASGVSSIAWSNDKGGSGTTSGATGWLFSSITLSGGSNVITVTATDKANNTSTDTITVTYGAAPSASTGSATNLTSNSATLTETVNANGLSTTVWFEYGTISGVYGSKSATQSVSGSNDTTVSISITGLLSGKTYYYRIVAQNSAGTTYGAEKSFTTLDTTAPTGSISINGGSGHTKSTAVTLSLSSTDDVGVTGYFLSDSATTPSVSAVGWTSITSTTNYSGSVSYSLSSGDESKTAYVWHKTALQDLRPFHSGGNGSKAVYVWYKDAAGNVSYVAGDSITLDTTAPTIAITSPTSSATYTTTSNTINLGGSVSGSTSVSSVTWSNSKGGSGTASGTTNWSISGISLSSGDNVITVTVKDGANNLGTDTITVTYIAGTLPTVTTGSATNVTSSSATLNGTVNANGLSTTTWFEYGTSVGSYGSNSSTQSVAGSGDTAVSISVSGLSPGKTYYYRIVAQNSAGTSYGTEMSFTTGDTMAPACSISINSGDSYTNSTTVTLSLSATDDVGVTGYSLSTSSTTPLVSATGWTSVTSTTSYTGNVSYTLSSGDGSKTVYVWYKDATGNVSSLSSDSITLDMTVPIIAITSPTSNSTYTTTSSTISLSGSASDNTSGVSSVAWSNSTGGSGTATGTTNWSVSNIALQMGDNVITVTAMDAAGNTQSATLTITRNETTPDDYGIVGYWKLDETSGTTATDSSGNGNNGALINGPVWTTGKINNALSFDGVNDYVTTADTPFDFERTNSFSASAWIKLAPTTLENIILSKEGAGPSYTGWAFYVRPNGELRVFLMNKFNAPSNQIVKNSAIQVDDNVWHHVAFTYNGTSLGSGVNIYIDGNLSNGTVTYDNLSGSILNNVPLNIGQGTWGGGAFNGIIDEVRVYNRALTAAEVEQLYNMGK